MHGAWQCVCCARAHGLTSCCCWPLGGPGGVLLAVISSHRAAVSRGCHLEAIMARTWWWQQEGRALERPMCCAQRPEGAAEHSSGAGRGRLAHHQDAGRTAAAAPPARSAQPLPAAPSPCPPQPQPQSAQPGGGGWGRGARAGGRPAHAVPPLLALAGRAGSTATAHLGVHRLRGGVGLGLARGGGSTASLRQWGGVAAAWRSWGVAVALGVWAGGGRCA